MSEAELEITPTSIATLEDLQRQVAQLRALLAWTLVFIILLSAGLNLFLWRQYSYTRKDLIAARPQVNQLIAEYNRDLPRITEFLKRLLDFGKTHPDFSPILIKYRIEPSSIPATSPAAPIAPAGVPAPAAAPAPKK